MAANYLPKTSACEGGEDSRAINAKAKRARAVEIARQNCASQGYADTSQILARVDLGRTVVNDALAGAGFYYHPDKVWRRCRP